MAGFCLYLPTEEEVKQQVEEELAPSRSEVEAIKKFAEEQAASVMV
ncbi:MAG: hypothetical protein LUF35_04085 [Lachnospiraceae bacterium]|nr:hypothetical protein [Lachnospiraceae bacterium]